MRRVAVLTVMAALSLALIVGDGAVATSPGVVHLPDLRTKAPRDLRIQMVSGKKYLRLTNEVWNAGEGPVELRAENTGTTTNAYQLLKSHTAAGAWYTVSEQLVGTFTFHPEHNHWHFGDFAKYELRTVASGGGPGTLLRSGGKTSFCIVDTTQVDTSLPHAMPKTYTQCTRTANQGLSVGWSDTYLYSLAGQEIDITGVANGTYWLVSTADPSDHLDESNETNNAAQLKIQIRRRRVTVVG